MNKNALYSGTNDANDANDPVGALADGEMRALFAARTDRVLA